MSSTEHKRSCLILLSGYAPGLNRFLRWSDDFLARYQLNVKGDCRPSEILEYTTAFESEICQSDVFVHHTADALPELGEARGTYEALLARIAGRTHIISVPRPQMPTLWPFHVRAPEHDGANRPLVSRFDRQPCVRFDDAYTERHADPVRPFQGRFDGSPGPAYDDEYVLNQLRDGIDASEIAARYTALDVATIVDLDRNLAAALSQLRDSERTVDVKVADYVAAALPRERLFCAIDRPSNRLTLHMTNQILDILGCARAPAAALDRTQELHGWSCPVHPSIGRHFGLPYVAETTRYQIDRVRLLTFAEYIGAYARSLAGARP